MSNNTLTNNPWAQHENQADVEIPIATRDIYQYVNDTLMQHEDNNVLRASMATMCVKRRWFQRQGVKGIPLTPRKVLNFTTGDVVEIVLKHFILEACLGKDKLYKAVNFGIHAGTITLNKKEIKLYDQPTLSFKLPTGQTVTAHPDGFGQRHDGSWELIEIKSAANWGFDDFKKNDPDYLAQAHAVMLTEEATAMNCRTVRFFYMRKETGHIWDRAFPFDDTRAAKVIEDYIVTLKEEMPPAPFSPVPQTKRVTRGGKPDKIPTGKETVKFPCTYCPFIYDCHGTFDLEWERGQFGVMTPSYTRPITY